jgi:hypothetical protein
MLIFDLPLSFSPLECCFSNNQRRISQNIQIIGEYLHVNLAPKQIPPKVISASKHMALTSMLRYNSAQTVECILMCVSGSPAAEAESISCCRKITQPAGVYSEGRKVAQRSDRSTKQNDSSASCFRDWAVESNILFH